MTRKKIIYLLGLLTIVSLGANAQNSTVRYWEDSSYVSNKRLPQRSQFMNNAYPYPAKPKDMLQIGINGGVTHFLGSIPANLGIGVGINVRKAIGHSLSWRLGYTASRTRGIDIFPNSRKFPPGPDPWDVYTGGATPTTYFANFENRTHQGSFDLLFNLGNIRFYKDKNSVNIYALAGYSFMASDVRVNALGADGKRYDFSTINTNASASEIRKAIKDKLDDSYESKAPSDKNDGKSGDLLIKHALDFGGGLEFRISKHFDIALEQKFSFFLNGSNAVDGHASDPKTRVFSYTSLGLEFNLGNSQKRVEPLWWVNPLAYAYNELNTPKHMKIPKQLLDDSDGDGVPDQFDLEPNTPKGAPVDTHGVSRDTDGDGVPDYKDKELITPTKCLPVDADGVGNCPDPECCKNKAPQGCNIGSLPSVSFKEGSSTLSNDAKAILANVAEKMRNNPECNVDVVGFSKKEQSSSKVQAVINFLVDQLGIQSSRVNAVFTKEGVKNVVDLNAR